MKFSDLRISNFRQYYHTVELNLNSNSQRNIVLVGGKNGYGKTNLLLSVVWCMYGEKISLVDDNFKKEIQKERNYSAFMQQSLNWSAKKDGIDFFSVEITINDIELPIEKDSFIEAIIIKRTFNVTTMDENLSILNVNNEKEIFEDYNDRVSFINDYLIPIEAAKFVFFDAEKISEIANLTIKEEGNFINDALGKILGLDDYESLIEDLELYKDNLKKQNAKKNIQEQIADKENAIKIVKLEIESLEASNAERLKENDDFLKKGREYEELISQHSKSNNTSFNRDDVVNELERLKVEKRGLTLRFNELSEVIPLALLTGQIEEVFEHLELQNQSSATNGQMAENLEKIDDLIERLFNRPPQPENPSISLKDKMFYYNRAKDLASDIFSNSLEGISVPFEHDVTNFEKELISNARNAINSQSKDFFEKTIEENNKVQMQITELSKNLKKIDADLEDELVLEYVSKKEQNKRRISDNHETLGQNKGKIARLNKDITRLNQHYQSLLTKVEINQINKQKINKSDEYLEVLKNFVTLQKEEKKNSLARNILHEMHRLMHKLNTDANNFVADVQVSILPDGNGMKVTLYNSEGGEIKKEVLSQGEKQLYISSLIKAILKESVQSLPIFIDTPLGRLDDEHIKNILLYYYPNLSEQVVILSTNNEITPRRYKDIAQSVSRCYLMQNDGANTTISNGYFKGYEN